MPFSIPALATQCLASNVFRGQDSDGAGLLELVLLQVPRCGQDEGVMVLLRDAYGHRLGVGKAIIFILFSFVFSFYFHLGFHFIFIWVFILFSFVFSFHCLFAGFPAFRDPGEQK